MTTPSSYPRRIGRFDIQGKAGEGGMAIVYRAWDPKHQRVVAIKKMKPTLQQDAGAIRRFKRSARALYQLNHHHIMRVYGAGDEDGVPYLVLEYIDGFSLDRYLAGGQPMHPAIVAQIVDQVSQALDYAHARGVIHRDIKPSNILLTRDARRAVLSDFGLALVLGQARLTLPGIILGTPRYMAPEQVKGTNIDARTDIYALGVTCYEMLTGQPAFNGRGAELAIQIINGQYRPPSQVNPALSPAVDNVIRNALLINPSRRYQTATQFSRALRAGLGLGSTPPGSPSSEMKPTRKREGSTNISRIILIVVCMMIIVAAVAALVILTRGA